MGGCYAQTDSCADCLAAVVAAAPAGRLRICEVPEPANSVQRSIDVLCVQHLRDTCPAAFLAPSAAFASTEWNRRRHSGAWDGIDTYIVRLKGAGDAMPAPQIVSPDVTSQPVRRFVSDSNSVILVAKPEH
jgi:hypothetical protein